MGLTRHLPGLAPGQTVRNAIVLVLYLVLFPLIPFVLAYAVLTNRNQFADYLRLRGIPWMRDGGGAKPAAITLIVLLVSLSLVATVSAAPFLVFADSGDSSSEPDSEPGSDTELVPDDDDTADDGAEDGSGAGNGADTTERDDTDTADDTDSLPFLEGDSDEDVDWHEEFTDEEREANTYEASEDFLTSEGHDIIDGEMNDGVIYIEYRTYAEDQEEAMDEIQEIVILYAVIDGILMEEMTEEGYDGFYVEQTEGMHVTVRDVNDVTQATYHIEGDWAREFRHEEISLGGYMDRVEETIEIPDHFDNGNDNSSGNNSSD